MCRELGVLRAALAHRLPRSRLAEKKASIGYTYEDSTVAEVEKVAEKPEEEESPAEEESNSDEDEVIPDIGGVPSLPSPSPQSLGIVFLCVSCPSPSVGHPVLTSPVSTNPAPGHFSLLRPSLSHPCSVPSFSLCVPSLNFRTLLMTLSPPRFWLRSPTWVSLCLSLPFVFSSGKQVVIQLQKHPSCLPRHFPTSAPIDPHPASSSSSQPSLSQLTVHVESVHPTSTSLSSTGS